MLKFFRCWKWLISISSPERAVCRCEGTAKHQVRGKLQHLSPFTSPLTLTKCTERFSSILIHLMCISSPFLPFKHNDSNLAERWKQVEAQSQVLILSSRAAALEVRAQTLRALLSYMWSVTLKMQYQVRQRWSRGYSYFAAWYKRKEEILIFRD